MPKNLLSWSWLRIHRHMSRSSGQFDAEPPVSGSQANFVFILSTLSRDGRLSQPCQSGYRTRIHRLIAGGAKHCAIMRLINAKVFLLQIAFFSKFPFANLYFRCLFLSFQNIIVFNKKKLFLTKSKFVSFKALQSNLRRHYQAMV